MRTKVAIVKLAAMGDVAIACRALKDFSFSYDVELEIHWAIDKELVGLAQALLDYPPAVRGMQVHWHALDSASLFRGKASRKAAQAIALFRTLARSKPRHLLLLHRDWRYRVLLRPAFRGSTIAVNRARLPELDAYTRCFDRLARKLQLPATANKPLKRISKLQPTNSVGILVGGARNQKLLFQEKRWPRLGELLEKLITDTTAELHLFGSPDDCAIANDLLARFPDTNRIVNHVGILKLEDVPKTLATLDSFISIDSGLAHIAAAVMTASHQRIITLFGPTDPDVWAPRATAEARAVLHYKSPACSPCYLDDGDFQPCRFEGEYFQHCMRDISVEEVLRSLYK